MDGLTDIIVKFIREQPKDIQQKYTAFLKLKIDSSDEAWRVLYANGFSFEDMRIFTSGLTHAVLDKAPIETILSAVNSK